MVVRTATLSAKVHLGNRPDLGRQKCQPVAESYTVPPARQLLNSCDVRVQHADVSAQRRLVRNTDLNIRTGRKQLVVSAIPVVKIRKSDSSVVRVEEIPFGPRALSFRIGDDGIIGSVIRTPTLIEGSEGLPRLRTGADILSTR